jgi:hypothetical protein
MVTGRLPTLIIPISWLKDAGVRPGTPLDFSEFQAGNLTEEVRKFSGSASNEDIDPF